MKTLLSALVVTVFTLPAHPVFAEDVEALHWWTSGGEAAAIAVLKDDVKKKGYGWKDVPVAGGGGDAALTALKARVTAGNPPTASQLSVMGVRAWAEEGLLGDLTPLAEAEGWSKVLLKPVLAGISYDGKVVAVPFNLHRSNWMWMNAAVFAKYDLAPPKTWDEFYAVGDKLKAAGIIPLALGGEPWQETILFEDAVLSAGGADLYRKALLDLDPAALTSDEMVKAFDTLRKIIQYVDPNYPGRAWNLGTAMVLKGEAGMQLMGDWAKGEIVAAKLVPGKDILCAPAPGNTGTYTFHFDAFGMFPTSGAKAEAQKALATSIMDPSFQETFNLAKGSIPARIDVKPDKFDVCAQQAMKDIKQAEADDALVGSVQGGAAQPPAVQGAIQDVVARFFSSDQSSTDAAKALADAIADAK